MTKVIQIELTEKWKNRYELLTRLLNFVDNARDLIEAFPELDEDLERTWEKLFNATSGRTHVINNCTKKRT